MEKIGAEGSARTIESLTRNLLECYEELDLVYRLSGQLLSSLDVQRNVERILGEAMEIFDADLGWVGPAGSGEGLFRPVTTRVGEDVVALLTGSVVGELIEAGKSRMYYALRDEPGLSRDGVPQSFLCTVIKTDRAVYGALCVGRHDGESLFTAGDLKLADVLASQAAIALENFLLNQRRIDEQQAMIRMQEELRLALEIQANLLPKGSPSYPGYDIAGRSVPALGVGGDYYDFIPIDERMLAISLGDVSGKGMPAALLMANLQASIRGQTLMKASPADCLHRSNTLLFQSTDSEKFATCFYGILDTAEHRLWYANAGHEHPMIFSPDGGISVLDTGGLVLGVMREIVFPEASVEVRSGDVLVIYSDGITDSVDGNGAEYGLERLTTLLHRQRGLPAEALMNRIMDEVDAHAGSEPPFDDRTLVVIRRE